MPPTQPEVKVYRNPITGPSLADWIAAAEVTDRTPQFYVVSFVNPNGIPDTYQFLTADEAAEFEAHIRGLGWRVARTRADVFVSYPEAVDSIAALWKPEP
jgi:hypothetical protein